MDTETDANFICAHCRKTTLSEKDFSVSKMGTPQYMDFHKILQGLVHHDSSQLAVSENNNTDRSVILALRIRQLEKELQYYRDHEIHWAVKKKIYKKKIEEQLKLSERSLDMIINLQTELQQVRKSLETANGEKEANCAELEKLREQNGNLERLVVELRDTLSQTAAESDKQTKKREEWMENQRIKMQQKDDLHFIQVQNLKTSLNAQLARLSVVESEKQNLQRKLDMERQIAESRKWELIRLRNELTLGEDISSAYVLI